MSFHGPQPPIQQHTQPTNRNESFNVTPGGFVDSFQPHGFSQIQGIWVDNFSGGWLSIESRNLWIPPYTRGWKASVLPAMASITVRSYDFANGTKIAGANGTNAIVTIWNEPAGDSEGIDFFDQQTIPSTLVTGAYATSGVLAFLPAPPVGRIRVYEIRMAYAVDGGHGPGGVIGLFDDISAKFLAMLEISPASPSDFQIIRQPGGDLPIGSDLRFDLSLIDNADPDPQYVQLFTRYAII